MVLLTIKTGTANMVFVGCVLKKMGMSRVRETLKYKSASDSSSTSSELPLERLHLSWRGIGFNFYMGASIYCERIN